MHFAWNALHVIPFAEDLDSSIYPFNVTEDAIYFVVCKWKSKYMRMKIVIGIFLIENVT